ncbi:tyrosine-type recombinase/integrase [Knoellia sp. LjRoot47]|uniref:tyrosine-type recombinase/integrase n=1 Tax=Knoellia sp. LjRoot47 TaxID=3342330 RepID=UPI003ECFF7BF
MIVANLPEIRRAIALLCSWCAMRIGEVLELRRKDIDLAKKVVRVERSVAWVAGKPMVGSPKSAAGRRVVSIPPHVVPALKEHLDRFVSRGQESLLFPATDGTSHLQPTVFHDAFSKARAVAGRDDLRVHNLRHTGATLARLSRWGDARHRGRRRWRVCLGARGGPGGRGHAKEDRDDREHQCSKPPDHHAP